MNPVTLFSGATGLNTVDDPTRVRSTKGGSVDLTEAVNVRMDSSLQLSMRRGFKRLRPGPFHSLFCDGGDCFVVKRDVLCQIGTDGSWKGIIGGLAEGRRMAYVQAGERTYFTNGIQSDFILHGTFKPWAKDEYLGPDTTRHFSERPIGSHLAVHSGRMYVAVDNVLFWSEPFQFGLFNLGESGVQFNTRILMVRSVDTGLFVSTEKKTYFLAGKNPMQFNPSTVAEFPACEWSDAIAKVQLAEIGFSSGGLGVLWASPQGAIVGSPGGFVKNLTREKIIYPKNVRSGFGCLRGFNFIHGVE